MTRTELRQERNRSAYELEEDLEKLAELRVEVQYAGGAYRRQLAAEIAGIERRIAWLERKAAA